MSHIDDKHGQLKSQGLDLGPPLGPEEDAGFGGRVRRYEHGNIYWHHSTGAHEVHGGILDLYLQHGGHDFNPTTGRRHFGFPRTDEVVHPAFGVPTSVFETGQIYWVPETRGCAVYGSIYDPRREVLGMPITSNIETADFVAAFFERGVRFRPKNPAGENPLIDGTFQPPLMGRPHILDLDGPNGRVVPCPIRFMGIERAKFTAIDSWRPSVWSDLARSMFALAPCDSPFSLLPVNAHPARITSQSVGHVDVAVALEVAADGHANLKERTLYDLVLNMPNGLPYPLSPHCLYVKSKWDGFGLLHITDLHICRRNEEFRGKLAELGLVEAAQQVTNFQDSLRDFIKYANRLHALGLADAVVATGDLVDYVHEDVDNQIVGNFGRLRRLLLGQAIEGGAPATEELKIPIFMTFGNHDYRLNPYDLRANIDLPGDSKDTGLNEHSPHNLTEEEAIALQGGKTPTYDISTMEGAGRMLQYDRFDNKYNYFKKYMTKELSYVVRLGGHRLVVLDTKMDNGVPENFDIMTLLNIALGGDGLFEGQFGSGLPATQKLLAGGGPDSVGFGPDELSMLRNAIQEAGTDGVVIVGMHCPPLSPEGGEYAYFMRETIHPFIDSSLITAYLDRHKIQERATWAEGGTAFFKIVNTEHGMDRSVIAYGRQEFLDICAGKGVVRPVDLVLFGHKHDRVEYRIGINDANGEMQFFTDFYTENPKTYYHTANGFAAGDLKAGAPIQVEIEEGAPATGAFVTVRDHGNGPTRVHGRIKVPPYSAPLNSQAETKQWWADRRPVFAQTSALGPIDPRQRFARFFKMTPATPHFRPVVERTTPPNVASGVSVEEVAGPVRQPTFQGFRFIQVKNNVIHRVRYVTMPELREADFKLPWESEGRFHGGVFDASVLHDAVLADIGLTDTPVAPTPMTPLVGGFHRREDG